MINWKKLVLRAAAFGAGFAIMAALLVALAVWWSKRPVKPKPWNTSAMTAEYRTTSTEGDKNTLEFVYSLQNNTDEDYSVNDNSRIMLGFFSHDVGSRDIVGFDSQKMLTIEYPAFVPARGRVFFSIHVPLEAEVKDRLRPLPSSDKYHDWEIMVARSVDKMLPDVEGIMMLDQQHRYQINFPNGWTAKSKQALREKETAAVQKPVVLTR